MGIADLRGARAKLARADEHMATLEAQLPPSEAQYQLHQEGDWLVVSFNVPPYPNGAEGRLATIVGDYLNNIRTALDHIVWQLVLRDDNKPSRSNSFPLERREEDFIGRVKTPPTKRVKDSPLFGITVDGDSWIIIEASQPYHMDPPEIHQLATLSQLNNIDKHQVLLILMSWPKSFDDLVQPDHGTLVVELLPNLNPLRPGQLSEVVRLRFDKPTQVHVRKPFVLQPSFGSETFQASIGGLKAIHTYASSIVAQLAVLPRVRV
jgi:hypothetical protein